MSLFVHVGPAWRYLIIGAFVAALFDTLLPCAAPAQDGFTPVSPFLGLWCINEDPNRSALITRGPFGLKLQIENGPTSTGVITGPFARQVTAPQWNLIVGTLSDDQESINWSNNTYWARCRPRIDVQGTWYLNGDPTHPCRINQNGGLLSLVNDAGQPGTGRFISRTQIAAQYYGIPFRGTIAPDHNRIDWDNGTYWSR